MKFDLEKRCTVFSKEVFLLLKRIKITILNKNIILQVIRSATSIGANYCEANNASSRKDFRNKIYICKKEVQETKYWFELLLQTNHEFQADILKLQQEAHELTLIFNKITQTLNQKNN